MSASMKQICRSGACQMKAGFRSTLCKPLTHDIRYLSYLNGNILQTSNNSMNHCNHSNHSFCNSNCLCTHSKSSISNSMISNNNNHSLNNFHNNSLNHIQMRMCSSQQRDTNNSATDVNNENEQDDDLKKDENEQESESDIDNDTSHLDARIEELEKEAARWKDVAARAQADLFNHDAMSKKDIDKARKYAVKKFSKDILEVADALRGAVDAIDGNTIEVNEATEQLVEGVRLTQRRLLETFEKNGITLMDCEGQEFDPNYHEALTQQVSAEHEPGTVLRVVTQGYNMHDYVLRSAKVIVAREPDQ